ITPSAAIVQIFSENVLAFEAKVFDQVQQSNRSLYMMWNGQRWWTAEQSQNIRLINSYQVGAQTFCYGSTGLGLYPLFTERIFTAEKRLQSKLWRAPNIAMQKAAWGFYILFEAYSDDVSLFVSIDTENGFVEVPTVFTSSGGSEARPVIT